MKLRICSFIVYIFVILFSTPIMSFTANSRKTNILVVGTIHQRHAKNPNYTYYDLVNIISTFSPDVICVEIRPADFEKEPYLKEMMLATVWGKLHKKNVYPIDWWDDSKDLRKIRMELEQQPEYKKKEEEFQLLVSKSLVMNNFEKKYGENFWKSDLGYQFFNGAEYNNYFTEFYKYSMMVYGDSPINLNYQTRNEKMMSLIWDAINNNRGKKILVLTGTEHKHFFDKALNESTEVSLINFESILPLKKQIMEQTIINFFEEENDLLYYKDGYPKDLNNYYRIKLIDLIHGPDMDFKPEIISEKNIVIAGKVIERWKKYSTEDIRIIFETGWYNFLKGDYVEAIRQFTKFAKFIEDGKINELFLVAYTFRNLGLSYDMAGEREKAVQSYKKAENIMMGTSMERSIKSNLRDYKTVPYKRLK